MKLSALLVVIGLVCVAQPATAFREIAPGARCESILEVETSLGATVRGSVPPAGTSDFKVRFSGEFHGEDAVIFYKCSAGVVARQLIQVQFEDEREATLFFSERRRELSDRFGPPTEYLDEPRISELRQDLGSAAQRFASWVLSERMISLMLSGGNGEPWQAWLKGP